MGEIDTEGKTGIASPYNDNNIIYKTNKSFMYEVDQVQTDRRLKFNIEMVVIPGAFNMHESRIKYKFYYDPKDLDSAELKAFGYQEQNGFAPEFSSLKEEKNDITFHPPRSKTLACLEAAPFPALRSKIEKGMQTKEFLFIPKGSWGKLGGSTITWRYRIDSVAYVNDTIPYYCHATGTADSKKGGHNILKMHFNTDSGFTKLSYRFQDLTTVDFILKEIK